MPCIPGSLSVGSGEALACNATSAEHNMVPRIDELDWFPLQLCFNHQHSLCQLLSRLQYIQHTHRQSMFMRFSIRRFAPGSSPHSSRSPIHPHPVLDSACRVSTTCCHQPPLGRLLQARRPWSPAAGSVRPLQDVGRIPAPPAQGPVQATPAPGQRAKPDRSCTCLLVLLKQVARTPAPLYMRAIMHFSAHV